MSESATRVAPRLTVDHAHLRAVYRRDSFVIVVLPLLAFAGAVAWAFTYGIQPLDLVLAVTMYTIAAGGIELGFHRLFAHRSYTAHPALSAVLAICGSMAAQGRLVRWASNHRRHHGYSDGPEDPHSPHGGFAGESGARRSALARFWHAHVGWIFSHEPTNTIHFSKDILRDPMLATINRFYLLWLLLGIAIPAAVGVAVRGHWMGLLEGALWGWGVPIFLSQQAAFFVNSLGHYVGQQPFETGDHSKNSIWLAVPSLGAGWQNNHHAFPSSSRLGVRWWEIDLGRWMLLALEKLGLAWDLKTLPDPQTIASRRRTA